MDGGERLGLFGGTFDPVHAGHLAIAGQAAEELRLDHVFFIPAADPPHKKMPGASFGHRVAMLEAALIGKDKFSVSLLEAESQGPSYTVDTVLELKRRLAGRRCSLYFLIGADSLLELHLWRRCHELLRLTSFIVVSRPGISLLTMGRAIEHLPGPFFPDASRMRWRRRDGTELFFVLNRLKEDISSSAIRAQLRLGEQPSVLDRKVLEHVERNRLYLS